MSFALSRDDLADAGFLAALGLLALIGFRTTYAGWSFLFVGAAGLLLGMVIAYLARAAGQPVITVAALTVLVFFLLGSALVLRSQALAGVLPTSATLHGLAHGGVAGWKELLTTLAPVEGGPLLVIPYILGLSTGAAGFTLARRFTWSALPVLAPGVALVAVILFGTSEPANRLLQGVVFAAVALCWAAYRAARSRPATRAGARTRAVRLSRLTTGAAVLAVAAGLTALVAPMLPGIGANRTVLRDQVTPPVDLSAYPSPLVGFRKFTKDAHQLYDQKLLTVAGLPDGASIRFATLDDYNGLVWAAGNGPADVGKALPRNGFQRIGGPVAQSGNGSRVSVTITVEPGYAAAADLNAWVPDAGELTGISFAGRSAGAHEQNFRYNLATSTGLLLDRLGPGDSYTVHAVVDAPAVPADPQQFGSSTVDSSWSSLVGSKAVKWAGAGTGTYARVRAVADYLRQNGAYSDGGPGEGNYLPGHSAGRLYGFLNAPRPVGDDEQYAAAFALIANNLGMPARVVLGARPEAGGVIKGQDVHAWVEIHLAGGWTQIPQTEFMPDQSKKPDTQPPQQIQDANAAVVPPPNTVHPPGSLADFGSADLTLPPHPPTTPAPWQLPAFVWIVLKWVVLPTAVIAALAQTVLTVKARRRKRRRTRGSAATRVAMGWREIVDVARDLGDRVPSGGTRREQSVCLARHDVAGLAAEADAIVFGPGEPTDDEAARFWSRVDAVRVRMTRSPGRWRRIRAALSLATLFHLSPTGATIT